MLMNLYMMLDEEQKVQVVYDDKTGKHFRFLGECADIPVEWFTCEVTKVYTAGSSLVIRITK